jgi:hypothetical protein
MTDARHYYESSQIPDRPDQDMTIPNLTWPGNLPESPRSFSNDRGLILARITNPEDLIEQARRGVVRVADVYEEL